MDYEHGSKDSKLPGIVIDESGETKQSETLAKVPDGSEEIKQSKTPAKVLDGSGESKQSETHLKILGGSRESKQSETPPKVSDGSGESKQSEAPAKVSDRSGEIKQPETHAEVSNANRDSKQSETPLKVLDGSRESKQQSETTPKVLDGKKEGKQPETPSKVPNESEESKQLETHPKVNDGMSSPPLQSTVVEETAKGDHPRSPSETLPQVHGENGGGNKHSSSSPFPSKVVEASQVNTKGGHRRAPSGTLLPKANDGSGGSKHSFSPPPPSKVVEATSKGDHIRTPSDRLLSFTSTSSSGSDTSMDDDLFQVDSSRFSASSNIPPLPKDHSQNSPYRPSTSRLSNVNNGLPTESPGIQMMDRYGAYDPYRIPASVFDTNNLSNREMEWSVASNESLFSLHLGNNSFSREHVIMLGDLGQTKSGELFGISTPRTPPPAVATEIHRIEEGRESAAEELADENLKDIERASAEHYYEGSRVPAAPTISSSKSPSLVPSLAPSHRSDGSGYSAASARSFAFPILTDGTKNSLKLAQESEEEEHQGLQPTYCTSKKQRKKRTRCRWFPCFSWCCKWSCGCCCSWYSCRRFFCCCSCRFCSCPRCFHRTCCCF